jgi:hypothetical protein
VKKKKQANTAFVESGVVVVLSGVARADVWYATEAGVVVALVGAWAAWAEAEFVNWIFKNFV